MRGDKHPSFVSPVESEKIGPTGWIRSGPLCRYEGLKTNRDRPHSAIGDVAPPRLREARARLVPAFCGPWWPAPTARYS